ncbi:MAG: potassium channel family protein [Pseudomonadota bacterium]
MSSKDKIFVFLLVPFLSLPILVSLQEILGNSLKALWSVGIGLALLFVLLNGLFFRELYRFIVREHSKEEVYLELMFVFVTAFSNILLFAAACYFFGVNSGGQVIFGDIATSLYFSIVTWTTLGYGDISPVPEMRLIASIQALIGYTYMAILIGLFLSVVNIKVIKQK